jgi:hypothetical protein
MRKRRVLYLLYHFPQISETYVRSEIEAVLQTCEVRVISLNRANAPYRNHVPFTQTDDPAVIREVIEEFRPDVLHTHWLQQIPTLAYFAGVYENVLAKKQVPFTVRAHSFDVLDAGSPWLREAAPLVNSDLCLGVLSFPFTRPLLERAGIRADKIRDCFPVVHYRRFVDRSPNGGAVMNVGACLPKKQMEDFLTLAAALPEVPFNLYAMGYDVAVMDRLNRQAGSPVAVVPPVEPEAMPAEYKKHRWLVYTAARDANTVGWPMAVAEAQASGVGVCVPNLRPDLREYVGEAGVLYDSISEALDVIRRPFPEEMRQLGFEQAKKSDVFEHVSLLFGLWDRVASLRRTGVAPIAAKCPPEWEWKERYHAAMRDVARVVPGTETFLLADECQLGDPLPVRPRMIPFPESDGGYAGPPTDDESAIRALQDSRRSRGARFLIFAWPAFWWLDHYSGLHRHLRSEFSCVLENDRLVVFDLGRQGVADG